MIIREFRNNDAQECSKIRTENFERILSKVYSPNDIRNYIELFPPKEIINHSKKNQIFVAEENGKIIGFISIKIKDEAEIPLLYVSINFQNKGIGSKLYLYSENWLKKKYNATKIIVHAAPYKPTLSFYEKLEFKNNGKVIHNDRGKELECILLTKILSLPSNS